MPAPYRPESARGTADAGMHTASIYRTAMGDAFQRLAAPLRQFHGLAGQHTFHGQVAVQAPASWAAKALAFLLGTPLQAAQGAIRFELQATPQAETWTRFFPGQTMHSTFALSGTRVTEHLGASRLAFALQETEGALEMQLHSLHFWGIPCPRWLMPQIVARETGRDQQLHFQVQASVPGIGRVASYTGYLHIPAQALP